jgi:hypothetical protein
MGDEPYTTLRMTSSPRSGRSTSPHQAAYATERARVLFGSYRRGDANDPEAYVAAIAAVLTMYDTDLIREVTDPRSGIAATEKFMTFMPHAGELKVYCDGVAARKERMRRYAEQPRRDPLLLVAPEPAPGDLASMFVPNNHARYAGLVEWSSNPRLWKFGCSSDNRAGIWVSYDTWVGAA